MLELELRLVLEPTRLGGGGRDKFLLPSLRSGFGVLRPERGLPRSNFGGAFLPEIFFSLANLAWRSTSEILLVFGELEPEVPDEGLEMDDIFVLALVILGFKAVLAEEEEETDVLTMLANDKFGLT